MEFKPGDKVKCVKRIKLPGDWMNFAEEELKIDEEYIIDGYYRSNTVLLKHKKYEHSVDNFVKVTKK